MNTDLTDAEWALVADLLERDGKRGAPPRFKRWADAGVFEVMHDRLRQQWRDRVGKAPEPTAAIIDAQSTRSTAQGGTTGFGAGKKVQAIEQTHGISVEVVRHPGNRSTGTWQDAQQPLWPETVAKGFVVQAKRWVVERTQA